MSLKQQIRQVLLKILTVEPYNLKLTDILVEAPANPEHGDYATSVALKLTKSLRKAPKLIAQELITKLNGSTENFVFMELNGFINIRVADSVLFANAQKLNTASFQINVGQDKTVLLEFVSANPTGPLHIGHGRWAVIGDCLARILTYCGYKVSKEFYINDAGNQINKFLTSVEAAKNNQPIPEDGYHGSYIKDLAALSGDPVQGMINHQRDIMASIQVVFDTWFSEKTLHVPGGPVDQVLEVLKSKGVLYESEGATWFKTTDLGDDKDRVLIRSNGEKTYFTADIAYHKNKLDRGFDRLINIWGADHHGYIPRVQAAIKALSGKSETNLTVILGQLVNLFRNGEPVRMSKRTGEMITLEEVIQEIGADATRYFLTMRSCDSTLDFDLELAKQKSNDNPVYYVQYAYARICSILRQDDLKDVAAGGLKSLEKAERQLLLKVLRLPDELEIIVNTFAIQRLTAYAEELAKQFHVFYHDCRVITDDKDLTAQRVQIIKSVQICLQTVFSLLAVSAPEKM